MGARCSATDRGFSLLELMIATAIIALVILATGSVLTRATQQNHMVREEAAAMRAARAKIAEIRAATFAYVVGTYENQTFRVHLIDGSTQSLGLEVGGIQQAEGEVVIIKSEVPNEAAYGRDMDAVAGPDGVDLNGDGGRIGVLSAPSSSIFPLNLNGDEDSTDSAVLGDNMVLIPVVVIIRWRSFAGPRRRIELMTLIGRP